MSLHRQHDRLRGATGSPLRHHARWWIALGCLAAVATFPFGAELAEAQEAPALSFHIAPSPGAVEGLAEECGQSFADPLNQSGRLVQRASSEVAAVVSDCTSELGSASFSRECELAMATSTVDFIVLVDAEEDGEEWYFRTSVISPLRAATVWSDDAFVSGTRRRATADGCEELGGRFLSHLNIGPAPAAATDAPAAAFGVLEVLDTTPALVEVWIDGSHAGMSGGQLIVAPGPADIELRATGFQSYRQPTTILAGEVVTVRAIALSVLPAQLVVSANVAYADVFIDGVPVGVTPISGTLDIDVPLEASTVEVIRDGYQPFRVSLTGLSPGQRRAIDAELVAAAIAAPQPTEAVATPEPAEGERPAEVPQPGTPTAAANEPALLARFEGRLQDGDEQLRSGEFQDVHTFDAQAGQRVELVMRSQDFNSYLMLRGPNQYSMDNDDGVGVGANARMVIQFPETGRYTLRATSHAVGERGRYTLDVLDASNAYIEMWGTLPIGGDGTLEPGDLTLRSGEYYDSFAFFCVDGAPSSQHCTTGSTIDVGLVSRDFDAYVYLRGPDDFAVDNNDLQGTDAGFSFQPPSPGIYRVYMTTNRVGETGAYTVGVASRERAKWD